MANPHKACLGLLTPVTSVILVSMHLSNDCDSGDSGDSGNADVDADALNLADELVAWLVGCGSCSLSRAVKSLSRVVKSSVVVAAAPIWWCWCCECRVASSYREAR